MADNIKTWTTDELNEVFDFYRFKTQPRLHQLQTVAWACDKKRVSLWHDVGTGKSLTALYLAQIWGCEKILIVSPNSILKGWREQIELHTNSSYTILQGSADERREKLNEPADIYVINYEGLLVLFAEKYAVLNKQTGKDEWKRRIDHKAVRAAKFDCIIFDECHKLKSRKAHRTKIAHAMSNATTRSIIMTGTPVSTGEEDLWSEYWCLDNGATFDNLSYWQYMRRYFKKGWFEWNITDRGKERILEAVAISTLRFDREECCDLPSKTYLERTSPMTSEQKKLTDDIVNGLQIEIDDSKLGTQEILQQGIKLAQIAGGFLKMSDGTTKRFKKNPKIDMLAEVLEESRGKVIVFHEYIEEGRMIAELLRKMKIGFAELRGEVKDKDEEYRRFREDDDCRVLVAHPLSGGEGLNLQVASVIWFYSNGYSGAVIRNQCEGRIWRQGQERACVIGDLIVEGTIDQHKCQVLQDRKAMAGAILAYVNDWNS